MSGLRDRCPGCSRRLIITRFDTTFRLPDRSERLCFGIPGGLCEDCHQLYIDPELIELVNWASAAFSSWIAQLRARRPLTIDAGQLVELAAAQARHGRSADREPARGAVPAGRR